MPILYNAAQQAQIDAAQKVIDNAKKALAIANTHVTGAYNVMLSAYNNVQHYNKPASLTDQLAYGNMDPNSCTSISFNRRSCQTQVGVFNSAYSTWKDIVASQVVASNNLAAANAAMTTLLAQLAKDPNIVSQQETAVANITANAAIQRTKWIFFGVVVVVLVLAALFGGKMLLSRSSS